MFICLFVFVLVFFFHFQKELIGQRMENKTLDTNELKNKEKP